MGRQWALVWDMNYDGVFSISDVWLWFKWLYFYPGDLVMYVILQAPKLATFLEMTSDSFFGVASGVISGFVWLLLYVVIALQLDK